MPELRRRASLALAVAMLALALPACGSKTPPTTRSENPGFAVVQRQPHDAQAFTQGLAFSDTGRLFESTGRYGSSDVREVNAETGAVIKSTRLQDKFFGEGLTVFGGDLFQLTWKEGVVLGWDTDLKPLPSSNAGGSGDQQTSIGDGIEGEGWGLTDDENSLIQSDGSATLTFRDPASLSIRRTVVVTRNGEQVTHLNELEMVAGVLWANIWQTRQIVAIDPATGTVTRTVDLSSLDDGRSESSRDPEAVLNGIAHRPGDPPGRLWVTGKLWSYVYVIDVG